MTSIPHVTTNIEQVCEAQRRLHKTSTIQSITSNNAKHSIEQNMKNVEETKLNIGLAMKRHSDARERTAYA